MGQFAFNDCAHGQTLYSTVMLFIWIELSINIAVNDLIFPIMLKNSFCYVSVLNKTTKSLVCGHLVQVADGSGVTFNKR